MPVWLKIPRICEINTLSPACLLSEISFSAVVEKRLSVDVVVGIRVYMCIGFIFWQFYGFLSFYRSVDIESCPSRKTNCNLCCGLCWVNPQSSSDTCLQFSQVEVKKRYQETNNHPARVPYSTRGRRGISSKSLNCRQVISRSVLNQLRPVLTLTFRTRHLFSEERKLTWQFLKAVLGRRFSFSLSLALGFS